MGLELEDSELLLLGEVGGPRAPNRVERVVELVGALVGHPGEGAVELVGLVGGAVESAGLVAVESVRLVGHFIGDSVVVISNLKTGNSYKYLRGK